MVNVLKREALAKAKAEPKKEKPSEVNEILTKQFYGPQVSRLFIVVLMSSSSFGGGGGEFSSRSVVPQCSIWNCRFDESSFTH